MTKSTLIVLVLAAQRWAQDNVLHIYSLEAISPRRVANQRPPVNPGEEGNEQRNG